MSVSLKRHARLETVSVARITGVDGQGKPAYAAAVDVQARVVRKDEVVRSVVQMLRPGDETKIVATVYVDAEQALLPEANDRLTLADGLVGIVVERKDSKSVTGGLDHVRVKIREQ